MMNVNQHSVDNFNQWFFIADFSCW